MADDSSASVHLHRVDRVLADAISGGFYGQNMVGS